MDFENAANFVLTRVGPNSESESSRDSIYEYMKQLIIKTINADLKPSDLFVVFRYGSVPLMTYLSDGDLDLGFAIFSKDGCLKSQEACNHYLDLLYRKFTKNDIQNHHKFPIRNPTLVDAEVRVIKCSIKNIAIDISANKVGGCCSLIMLDLLDRLLVRKHIFKRSIVLIKSWCAYESHTLGSRNGLMSTYALEILIINIFYLFNEELDHPFQVLFKFLNYYSNFDWENYAITSCGPLPLDTFDRSFNVRNKQAERFDQENICYESLAAHSNYRERGIPILKLIETCRMRFQRCYGNYGYYSTKSSWRYSKSPSPNSNFVIKCMNIVDPLNINNNTGRSVSESCFFRTKAALRKGASRITQLIRENQINLLYEEFFKNTLSNLLDTTINNGHPRSLIWFGQTQSLDDNTTTHPPPPSLYNLSSGESINSPNMYERFECSEPTYPEETHDSLILTKPNIDLVKDISQFSFENHPSLGSHDNPSVKTIDCIKDLHNLSLTDESQDTHTTTSSPLSHASFNENTIDTHEQFIENFLNFSNSKEIDKYTDSKNECVNNEPISHESDVQEIMNLMKLIDLVWLPSQELTHNQRKNSLISLEEVVNQINNHHTAHSFSQNDLQQFNFVQSNYHSGTSNNNNYYHYNFKKTNQPENRNNMKEKPPPPPHDSHQKATKCPYTPNKTKRSTRSKFNSNPPPPPRNDIARYILTNNKYPPMLEDDYTEKNQVSVNLPNIESYIIPESVPRS